MKGAKVNHFLGTLTPQRTERGDAGDREGRGAAKPQNAIRTHASALQAAWAASTFTTFPFFSFSFCELVNWRVVFTSGRLAACVLAYSSHFANLYVGDKVKPA